MKTLENVSVDVSAMGRMENWSLAWKGAVDNPVVGVGLGNHIPYHQAQYSTNVIVRVAHSVYFQVLGELSFLGMFLFVAMSLGAYFTMWRNWWRFKRIAAKQPEHAWLRDLNFWLFCGFTGYLFGAGFLNMLYIEFPWYVMLFAALIYPLYLKSTQTASAPVQAVQAVQAGTTRPPAGSARWNARHDVRGTGLQGPAARVMKVDG
jgi:O-antigen ligase